MMIKANMFVFLLIKLAGLKKIAPKYFKIGVILLPMKILSQQHKEDV